MPAVSMRERRHQRTRDAILTAARRIVHEHGPAGLTMREIARQIEYSPAGLYEYFGSKEEIIAELCAEGFRRLTAQLESTDPALGALDYVRAHGLNYVAFARANPDFFLLMFTTAPLQGSWPGAPEQTQRSLEEELLRSPAFRSLHATVERCVREGVLPSRPDRTTFAMAMTLWQMVHGISMLAISVGRDFPDYPAHVERSLATVVRGLQG